MLRKRLIFTLIYSDGYFTQSRNFRLQKVGDIDWLKKNYDFKNTSNSIDELVILDASYKQKLSRKFLKDVEELAMDCFIPISVGGGINSIDKCKTLFSSGADKIVLNTVLQRDVDFVKDAISYYGSQSIIGSVDVKRKENEYLVFNNNGKTLVNFDFKKYLISLVEIGVGEIYLNSIDKDGTGFGFDLELIKSIQNIDIPVIISGGAGNYLHFLEVFKLDKIFAVSTSNLFNFMGDGLSSAREKLLDEKIDLSRWNYEH